MARLRKVHVTTGVAWVEAPDVGLQVLCGCPADAVKHLMRRGLIVQTERDGVAFETGPNAILLSDVMLQNGGFCNLAEFPVLQMLYRQGAILPGHPNNRGEKPVLIGLREQVESQLHYIYRGNYGLVSREEIISTGIAPDLADEMMAMKLKFAFGKIRHPRELLDTILLDGYPVTLKGGVTLRRLGLNIFEFQLDGESVTVDLNLPAGVSYAPPYTLGAHRVDRGYFSVIHSGEGDGWDPDRPTMASVLIFQGRIYLIDAGPNVQHSLTALGIGINEIEGVFHTHCHDDHFAGLTSLLRADRRIKYYATPLVRSSVMKKLSALLSVEEDSFADYFDVQDLVFDHWNDINGLEVMPLFSPHPVETNLFVFRSLWEEGYRSYAHFADIVSLDVLGGMRRKPGENGISQWFYEKIAADYAMPAEIKKLDIGGGLIHGKAEDFRNDPSGKIILTHTAKPLSVSEKEIGSGAPFGMVDEIIPGNHDYVWRNAYDWLRTYFPDTAHHELRVLLNSPLVAVNAESILVREGEPVTSVYLVITGTVEMFEAGSPVNGLLSAGAMLGEVAGIDGSPARKTYRAASFVQALKMSVGLYREFIKRNGLMSDVMALDERRNFLRSTWLCAEALTETSLNRLAKDMPLLTFDAGKYVDPLGCLALVKNGAAELTIGGEVVETLGPGNFFGEEGAIFSNPAIFRVRAATPLEVYLTAASVVRDVPVMRWKLMESHERRMHACVTDGSRKESPGSRWRDEYSVNIQRIDTHHKNLLIRANTLYMAASQGRVHHEILESLGFLVDYARFHFREEEQLMERYGCGDIETHRHKHRRLLEQVFEMQRRFEEGGSMNDKEIASLLRDWVLGHVLTEDRHFAQVLNERGIY
ncbi:bacteriohemerythrin [Telmatospirillum siberiense]|uniref:Cyclic nucleotide-binding protein n=1 Tax=Telmatospirillum siberiense TaxID=382514 RepID=A0A2N3PZU2_9PROT|nr:bacteriohemerythrin [Telmatospirillum siberiense]PKU25918.1 cyclic nucleotide-binding protein [Telmatospirillum siberiense]